MANNQSSNILHSSSVVLPAILIVCCCIFSLCHATIPPYIKICKSSDPKLAACIIESVNLLRPKLRDGIDELQVPPLDPMHLDEIKLRSGPNSAKIDANITNIKVFGPSQFEILELKANIPKARFSFKVLLPALYIEGDYDIDMRVILLNYKGQGPLTGNFTNYSFSCVLKGNRFMKEGKEYLKFDKMRLKLNIGQSKLVLGDIFKNDPILGRATNEVLSENSDLFITEIKSVLESSLAEKFTAISNIITLSFSYPELFPSD